MNKTKRDRFRRQLQQLLDRIKPDVAAVTEQARGASGGEATGELSSVPMHLGDMGTEEYLQDLNATLLVNEAYLLDEIRHALHRLDTGAYGTCERCGERIMEERLEAVPYTRYCTACAASAGTAPTVNLNVGRPRGPKDTLAPEGDMTRSPRRPATVGTGADEQAGEGELIEEEEIDVHAVGTAGGGTGFGGLAGGNVGNGEPDEDELQEAMGTGEFELKKAREGLR